MTSDICSGAEEKRLFKRKKRPPRDSASNARTYKSRHLHSHKETHAEELRLDLCHSSAFYLVHHWVNWVKGLWQSWKWPLMLNRDILLGGHCAYCNPAFNGMLRLRVTHTDKCMFTHTHMLRCDLVRAEKSRAYWMHSLSGTIHPLFPSVWLSFQRSPLYLFLPLYPPIFFLSPVCNHDNASLRRSGNKPRSLFFHEHFSLGKNKTNKGPA